METPQKHFFLLLHLKILRDYDGNEHFWSNAVVMPLLWHFSRLTKKKLHSTPITALSMLFLVTYVFLSAKAAGKLFFLWVRSTWFTTYYVLVSKLSTWMCWTVYGFIKRLTWLLTLGHTVICGSTGVSTRVFRLFPIK